MHIYVKIAGKITTAKIPVQWLRHYSWSLEPVQPGTRPVYVYTALRSHPYYRWYAAQEAR